MCQHVREWVSKASNQNEIKGGSFINILQTTFTRADLKSEKIQLNHQYLFTLLGSERVKAAHRTLMKLTQDLRPNGISG